MPRIKVVIIGNGIAGFSSASKIRRLNDRADVTMISKETLPLYSPCVLPQYISGKIPRKRIFVRAEVDYKELGLHTLFGCEVKEIDPIVKKIFLDDGKILPYDKLVLATGSDAVVFDEGKRDVFKLKTLHDADKILKHQGRKAVIVGSGAVAIEIAVALINRGYKVTIIARFDHIFRMGLDRKPADRVKDILEEHGVNVVCGEQGKRIFGEERVEAFETDKHEYECDTLIYAIGMRPKSELAEQASLKIGERGATRVDSHMETSFPGIYACGDCVETKDVVTGEPALNLFWNNANRQGLVAAHNVTDSPMDYPGSYRMFSLDVFGHHIAGFGYTEASLARWRANGRTNGALGDLSIIENEKDGSYYRLLILGDRCVGGQFIDIVKDVGLIWSIMFQRKSVKQLLRIFENEGLMCRRPWFRRVKHFFKNGQI